MPDPPLPVTYRAEVIGALFNLLRAGESCALVGVGSSGKSNVARHLARLDVRRHYLGEEAAHTVVLYLNCKPFAPRPPADFYLHGLDRLGQALAELDGVLAGLQAEVAGLEREAQDNPERLAWRNLDRAIGLTVRAGAKNVMCLLDDCDDLLAQAPPALFSELRALRDNHKVSLAYLTLTRREPAFLRLGTREYEELFELLSPPGHTLSLRPYVEADGLFMLQKLAARQSPPRALSPAAQHRLWALGGGHAGLMRTLFFAAGELVPAEADLLAPEALARLAAHADVRGECRKIVDSLEADEQADLYRIVDGQPPSADGLRRLERRGLVHAQPGGGLRLFSPIFERALPRPTPPASEAAAIGSEAAWAVGALIPIEFTGVGCHVRVGERLVTGLLSPEFELLRRLVAERPRWCPTSDLIQAMVQGEHALSSKPVTGSPIRRLEFYLEALRAKLSLPPQSIQAERDRYRLAA